MPESNHDLLVARIEAAIERGGLDEARRLIEESEELRSDSAELAELKLRLSVVESALSERGQVEAAIRQAREETSRANYPAALDVLQQALARAPGEAVLKEMLERTTKAALRHEAAVERNRAVAHVSERISELVDRGDLEQAMAELREANLQFGKHTTLLALRERLEALSREAELEKTVAFVDQARAFLDGRNWRAAHQQAERILRLDPKNAEAIEVRRLARVEVEREEAERQVVQEIDQASRDVERLIRADELPRAARALEQAVDRLGRHDVFEDLDRRLNQAKAELQAKKRLEWTQRRLREADDLVRQARGFLLQGRNQEAIERLDQARELHPDHPEIEDLRQAAQTAEDRALAERRRALALNATKTEIRQKLDHLQLDEAESRLQAAVARFGKEDPDFQALSMRLLRLREAEILGKAPQATGDHHNEAEALAHQRALATAYSWKQTLLYISRGTGVPVFWSLLGSVLALEILGGLPDVGAFFQILRWLVPFLALGWLSLIVEETYKGRNALPAWAKLLDLRRRGSDLAFVSGVALLALLPLFLFVTTRGWHTLFSGPGGWWLLGILGWGAAAVLSLSLLGDAFEPRSPFGFLRHLRALDTAAPDTFLACHFLFGSVVLVTILRATFLPSIPWIRSPLASAVEIYLLLTVPHFIGVVARRHRIELHRVYSPRERAG